MHAYIHTYIDTYIYAAASLGLQNPPIPVRARGSSPAPRDRPGEPLGPEEIFFYFADGGGGTVSATAAPGTGA